MMGVGELIVLLLSLGNFGVQANANAPSAAEITKYAPDSADAMVYIDLQQVVPNNWATLLALPDQPSIKSSPELSKGVQDVVLQAKGGLEMMKSKLGFDPVHDMYSLSMWVQYQDKGDPS